MMKHPKMKKTPSRRLLITLTALAAVGVGAATLAAISFFRPLTVAFFDMDPALSASMKATINAWAKESRIKVRYAASPVSDIGAKGLRGVDALFLYPSRPNKEHAKAFAAIAPELSGPVALPLLRSVEASDRAWALPLLADTSELAWRKDIATAGKDPRKARLDGLDSFTGPGDKRRAALIIAAGGSDERLIDLAGLLVLEKGGKVAYEKLADYLHAKSTDAKTALDHDLGGFSLRSSLECLFRYGKSGFIHSSWLDFKEADSSACVDSSIAGLSIQSLSIHRREKREILQSWGSAPIVTRAGNGLPSVTATLVSLARPARGRDAKAFGRLVAYLISSEGQRALESSTGLAPTSAGASAIDIQANEARSTVSGAEVCQGLSLDGFSSASARAEFAASLRQYLRSRQWQGGTKKGA
jgi:hypothetical protein